MFCWPTRSLRGGSGSSSSKSKEEDCRKSSKKTGSFIGGKKRQDLITDGNNGRTSGGGSQFKCDLSEALLPPSEENLVSIKFTKFKRSASSQSGDIRGNNNKSSEILLFYSNDGRSPSVRSSFQDFMDGDDFHYKSLWGKDINEWDQQITEGDRKVSKTPAVSSPSLNFVTLPRENKKGEGDPVATPFVCNFEDEFPLPTPPPTPPIEEKLEREDLTLNESQGDCSPPPLIYINTSTSTVSSSSISPPDSSASGFLKRKLYQSCGTQTQNCSQGVLCYEKNEVGTMTNFIFSKGHITGEDGGHSQCRKGKGLLEGDRNNNSVDKDNGSSSVSFCDSSFSRGSSEELTNSSLDSEDLISQIDISNFNNCLRLDGQRRDDDLCDGGGDKNGLKPEDRDSAVLLENHNLYSYEDNHSFHSHCSSHNDDDSPQLYEDRNRAAPSGKNGHSTEVVVQGQGQPHRRTSVSSTSTEKPSCEKSSAVPAAEVFIETSNLTNNNATITNNIVNNNNNNQQSSNGGRRTSSSTTVNAAVQENSALKEEMCRMSKVISTLEEQMKRASHEEHQQRSKWLSKISKVEKQTEALCVVAQYCDLQRETLEKKVIQNEEAAKITSQYLQEKEQEVESLRTELVREREYHKEELAEVVKNHQSQMDCLVKEQQTQICGLKKSNEEAILDKKKYAEEIERLKEAHRLELEQTSQRHRELLEEHRKQSPHDLLLREVESLEAVVEMRNEEIHKLRKDLIEYQRTIEDLQVTREHVRTLQAKVEDLEAQLEKGRNDKAKLREKYRELEMNLNHMEAKNSRLTRLNEELKYRMQTHGMMSSSLLGNDSFSSGNSREEHEDDQDDLDNTLGRGGQGTPARIADLVKD